MADNEILYNPTGSLTLASKDVAGIHHPRQIPRLNDGGTPVDAPGDNANGADVDVTRLPAGTTAAATTVAHGAADSGHPVKTGGVAREEDPAEVDALDRVDDYRDLHGRQIARLWSPRQLVGSQYTAIANTDETPIVDAGAAGVRRDLVLLRISNRHASTVVQATLRAASAGDPIDVITLPPNGTSPPIVYPVPLPQGDAAAQWTLQLSASVTVDVFAQYIEHGAPA